MDNDEMQLETWHVITTSIQYRVMKFSLVCICVLSVDSFGRYYYYEARVQLGVGACVHGG